MKRYEDKSICVVDGFLFTFIAEDLAEHFGKVYYYSGYSSAFPSSSITEIATGLDGVERIDEQKFWELTDANQIDLYVVTDCYYGGLTKHLRGLGKRVWGSGLGENLELYRVEAQQLFKKIGLPTKPHQVIYGMDKLRIALKKKENEGKWVKISYTRGDGETRRNDSYALSEPWLDEWAYKFGPLQGEMEFIIEENIPGVEIGYDGYCIDGEFPMGEMCFGVEIKDAGFVECVLPTVSAPEPIIETNERLSKTLKDYQYRGFFSTEIRVEEKTKTGYLVDPCCRCGSPPSQLFFELIENMAEIMWEGAGGKFIEPIFKARYGVLAFIHSEWAKTNWQPLDYPASIAPFVKLRCKTIVDGRVFVIPADMGMMQVGAVVATGDTLLEAVKLLAERAGQITGYQIGVQLDSIPQAMKEIEKMVKDYGYNFGDGKLPTTVELQKALQK